MIKDAQTASIKFLFEDTHLVVISKPSGLLSQGEITGDQNLVDLLREHFGRHYVGLVHRLDRETSGLMVIAKRSKSALRLTESLQGQDLERRYLAWVQGEIDSPKTLRHFLLKDPKTNRTQVVSSQTPGAKEAILRLTPIKSGSLRSEPITLIEFRLETGRSHQIRVQSAAEGHPLLGDHKYRGPHFTRLALHSTFLRFPHPMSREILEFTEPLPSSLTL